MKRILAWTLPVFAAAAVAPFARGNGGDAWMFVAAGRTLLSPHWSRAFADPGIQVGPLQLALFGSVGRSSAALAIVLGAAAALLVLAAARAAGVERPALLAGVGAVAVATGLTRAGFDAGHPADTLLQEEALLAVAGGPFAANRFVDEFQKGLASWKIHQDFQTHGAAQIRSPQVARAETQVSADGQNLISVLHSLYMGSRQFKKEVNKAMRAAFGEDFEELLFPPDADHRIQLQIRWRSLQRERSAADISDGTLRFLFLLAVLANPSPAPLIAIDEPETGLHPSMLPIVAEYAREAANKAQVILTTHSPEFLNAFGDDPPTTTVVECRDGETVLRVVSGETL
ncbi:MAG: AAA family ATPase, partial [Gaiellaceae bacterium]